jgi:transcriptional regulator with XRE-family HTH domain
MATILELSKAVHVRRSEIGLTQSDLAKLSGLSRQTINQVENGTVKDLSLNRAEKLAGVLGLSLHVEQPHAKQSVRSGARISPLARAAHTASVSYRNTLAPAQLRRMLVDGNASPGYAPHLHALLDEAPVSLLASLVEQLHQESAIDRETLWKNFRSLARGLKSKRDLWQ